MTNYRDNGGKLPAGITPIINTTGKPVMIKPKKNFFDHLIDAFKNAFKAPFKPKRRHITKVRRVWRGPNPITGRTFSTWHWQCALCDHNLNPRDVGSTHYGELCLSWEQAQHRATRHAHNHHGEKR